MTPRDDDAITELGNALAITDATATFNKERIVKSTLLDANYHAAIIACAMRLHAKGDTKRILAAWLKLLQFIAARPSLLPRFQQYTQSRRRHDLHNWALMPRGYMGDQTHDGLVDFLVASRVLQHNGDHITSGLQYHVLDRIADAIYEGDMFPRERAILSELLAIDPNKTMLGGS